VVKDYHSSLRVSIVVWFQPFEIGADYCGEHDINHPIVGSVPVSRDAAMTWSDVTVTSLAVAVTTADYTVAFVAMDDGTVRKVRLSQPDEIFLTKDCCRRRK